MRVLHICTEKTWRGGENQIRLFIEGSYRLGVVNFAAVPSAGRAYPRFLKLVETLALPSSSAYDPRSIWKLVRFCKKNDIEVLDGQGSGGLSLALAVKRFLPHLKLVTHRRVDDRVAQNFRSRRKYLSPLINKTVAISQNIKNVLIDCGFDASSIAVVPSAVDATVYQNLDRSWARRDWLKVAGWPDSAFIIGCASALVPAKGHDSLFQAFAPLIQSHPDAYLLLAGEGSHRTVLEGIVKALKIEHRVRFLGHIENVPEFLSALDLMVMPSLNEGLGTIVLDAMSAGTPVIGSTAGGIPEMVLHRNTGLIFEAGNSRALKTELDWALAHRENLQDFVNSAHAHIKQHFSLEAMVAGNVAVYKEVCGVSWARSAQVDSRLP